MASAGVNKKKEEQTEVDGFVMWLADWLGCSYTTYYMLQHGDKCFLYGLYVSHRPNEANRVPITTLSAYLLSRSGITFGDWLEYDAAVRMVRFNDWLKYTSVRIKPSVSVV